MVRSVVAPSWPEATVTGNPVASPERSPPGRSLAPSAVAPLPQAEVSRTASAQAAAAVARARRVLGIGVVTVILRLRRTKSWVLGHRAVARTHGPSSEGLVRGHGPGPGSSGSAGLTVAGQRRFHTGLHWHSMTPPRSRGGSSITTLPDPLAWSHAPPGHRRSPVGQVGPCRTAAGRRAGGAVRRRGPGVRRRRLAGPHRAAPGAAPRALGDRRDQRPRRGTVRRAGRG